MSIVDPLLLVDPLCYAEHGYPHEAWAKLRRESPVHRFDPEGWLVELRELAGDAALAAYGTEPAWTSPRTSPLARAFVRAARSRGA